MKYFSTEYPDLSEFHVKSEKKYFKKKETTKIYDSRKEALKASKTSKVAGTNENNVNMQRFSENEVNSMFNSQMLQ